MNTGNTPAATYLPRNSVHFGGSDCRQINPAPIRMMPKIKNRKFSQDKTIATINPVIARRIPVLPIFSITYILLMHQDKDYGRVTGPAKPPPTPTGPFYPHFPATPLNPRRRICQKQLSQ
ncbi:hypothetical protein Mboo_1029 [Methanoregula boonei 6A8]|uniref:Uncharacterized protein n=1 Tax=Methanoregula boonei (strain DSM 21154 / JCM 14090 / 6A8) TaxID=456442 RepID=A7I736_METB6|nr:hypothetical protein Mboo_1029 [Methanoregula boonei 6A8]